VRGDVLRFDAAGKRLHTHFDVTDLKHQVAMERRRARRERRREEYRRGLRPMAVAAWNVSKEYNVGSLVRTAHAAAATEVILVGEREWNVEAARTAELYTTVTRLADIDAFRNHLKSRRWNLVAVELDRRAVNLFDAHYPDRPCFLLGAELGGVPDELLDASELVVQIPQWGLVPSLNLAVAGSIVLYDYLAKLHREARLERPDGGLVDQTPGQPEGEDDVDHRG
jgi:tRNA G18 (ribose-2'-O)-methylase SpoU